MQRPQTLYEWHEMFMDIYGERNKKMTRSEIWLHLVEEAGEVADDLRYEDFEKLQEDLPDVLAWLCGFAGAVLGRNLEEIVWEWYPSICPRCGKEKLCTCIAQIPRPSKDLELLKRFRRSEQKKPSSLEGWQEMFTEIYGNINKIMSRSAIGFHLMEEIGEVAREIRRADWKKCEEEVADVFAFIIALVMKLPEFGNLSDALWNRYLDRKCWKCNKEKCECPLRAEES